MFRFPKISGSSCHKAPARRPYKPAIEGLEDRMVLSTAVQTGTALVMNISPGIPGHPRQILLTADAHDHTKLDIFDNGVSLGQFSIPSIKTAVAVLHGFDNINVDDSNGFPFNPGTGIALVGGGPLNSLILKGTQFTAGNEVYTAGTATLFGSLQTDFTTFRFSNAISSVVNELASTSGFQVIAQGQAVTLSSLKTAEQFRGLASPGGGGSTLTFANKPFVSLDLPGNNATATLSASLAAPGLKALNVFTKVGGFQTVIINNTPSTVFTDVVTFGQVDLVKVRGNSGVVDIAGNQHDTVFIGSSDDRTQSVTSHIKANVIVTNSFFLDIVDSGNKKTNENVQVSESSVKGSGLFGKSSVVVSYSSTPLEILTGQLTNTYVVAGSHSGALFSEPIAIRDLASASALKATIFEDAGSSLHLQVDSDDAIASSLFLHAAGGKVNPAVPPIPSGTLTTTFLHGLTSQIDYFDFDKVLLF
jgi:hypothetical protein